MIGAVPPASADLPNFYSKYGNSWRVSGRQSLFASAASRLPVLRVSNPEKVFTAGNLTKAVYAAARANCEKAGVAETALNDCILDVGVIGKPRAALSHLRPNLPPVIDRRVLKADR